MSPDEINITAELADEEINLTVNNEVPEVGLSVASAPEVIILGSAPLGPQGPPGPPGQWISLTQAEYDALDPPDPETLYVIVG